MEWAKESLRRAAVATEEEPEAEPATPVCLNVASPLAVEVVVDPDCGDCASVEGGSCAARDMRHLA